MRISNVCTVYRLPAQYSLETDSHSATRHLHPFTDHENDHVHSLSLDPPLSLAILVKIIKTYLFKIHFRRVHEIAKSDY
jgi:hypothetical protein